MADNEHSPSNAVKPDAPPNLTELIDTYGGLVYNLCLNYLRDTHDAEEAAQDVFVKVYQKIASFQRHSSLKTWIYRITVNHCLDVVKARRRQKRFGWVTGWFDGGEQPHEIVDFIHPGIQLEHREALDRLMNCIDTLPGQQKAALLLRYLDDLPQREIADTLQVSEKAVESLLQRGKANLEKKWRDGEGC